MNILYNCSEYPPFRNGGIGSVTKIIAEELVKMGHRVVVVGYYPELSIQESREVINGVYVFRYNMSPNLSGIRKNVHRLLNKCKLDGHYVQSQLSWYEHKISDLIEKFDINLVEITDFYTFNTYKCKLHYSKFKVPTVLRAHGSVSFMHYYSGASCQYSLHNDMLHFSRTDHLFSVSQFSQSYIDRLMPNVSFKSKTVIYNPIESQFIRHNTSSDKKIILFIGKLIKTKGAFAVIKAFNKIVEDFPDWELHMLGAGNQEIAKSFMTNKSINQIKLFGFCDRKFVANKIDECAFACIPSYFENFSMVPLEIMARTRCLIFTERTSGNEVIINNEDGYIVNPEDIDSIYLKMIMLIQDKQLRDSFARKGFEKVKNNFSADHICKILVSEYEKIIK